LRKEEGRESNTRKLMGEDVMTRSVTTQIHGMSGERERFGRRTREKALTVADLFCVVA
jgi:hypothetical protein